jgi:hypothetical protein
MPQRKTESRFLKRTGKRASAVGVGERPYADETNLLGIGASARTVSTFREFIDAGCSVDDALKRAIHKTDMRLYRQIEAHADADHTTFRSKMRRFQAGRRKH